MGLNIFGPTYSVLSKVLDVRAERHTVIASNIANADTPDYKSRHVKFEEELEKIMPREGKLALKKTSANHFPINKGVNDIKPVIDEVPSQDVKADGNTVDLDREIVRMSENHLMYNTVVTMLNKKFKWLMTAIRETK
jgi:flagellar basal-body rod protein FlgB